MKKGKILVAKTSDLFSNGIWKGFREDPDRKHFDTIVERSFFKERSEVEEDENLQQIIPQIILNWSGLYFCRGHGEFSAKSRRWSV